MTKNCRILYLCIDVKSKKDVCLAYLSCVCITVKFYHIKHTYIYLSVSTPCQCFYKLICIFLVLGWERILQCLVKAMRADSEPPHTWANSTNTYLMGYNKKMLLYKVISIFPHCRLGVHTIHICAGLSSCSSPYYLGAFSWNLSGTKQQL